MIFDEVMASELEKRKNLDLLRRIVPKSQNGVMIEHEGRWYTDLSSNDYLGLGQDRNLRDEFINALALHPQSFSSSGSPLLTGAHGSYLAAQTQAESLFTTKKVLFFNSGFAANSGCIAALGAIKGTVILADKLAHASIINGMTADRQIKAFRFPHNDLEALKRLVQKCEQEYSRILVVTEAVFSMDGDEAPLKDLVSIKRSHPKVALYIDEAHSFGVFDKKGRGLCAELNILDEVDFILCTCGKALGSEGAFMLSSENARNYFINTVRSLIFSTAISPAAFAHMAFMLKKLPECNDRRERLKEISAKVRAAAADFGNPMYSQSQVIPYLTYSNEQAVQACNFFKERGLFAMPIRHPTVPKGQARLRLSLSAALSDEQVDLICDALREYSRLHLKKDFRV